MKRADRLAGSNFFPRMREAGRGVVRRPMLSALALAIAALFSLAGAARANPVLLVEADSGRVLEQQDAGKPWYPASVTKLMTVYVALAAVKQGRISMDTPITVTPLAASQAPSKMGFKPGTQVTLDNAIKMVMVKSANDMAMVVAEGVGGSMPAFVDEMNATAQRLGMSGTHYANPNGLPDDNQITTARDLAILARAIIYHFPEHEMLFRIPAIKIGKRVLRNYNRLIDRYPGADGMKTGFICNSGFNLVATATRGNRRLIAVVLGSRSGTSRTEETALLFEKGFQSSWSIFGAAAPTLSAIQNIGGTPASMKDVVCGGKRAVAASEADDESGTGSFSFTIANGSLPASGAALLQNLPPSMPPIPVYVGTRAAPQDPDTAVAGDDKPKKKTASKPASSKPASSKSASKSDDDGAKDAAKDSKPKKPASASASAKPDAKGDAKSAATSSDKKKQVQSTTPQAAGASATPNSASKPAAKPKPKPADEGAAATGKPAT